VMTTACGGATTTTGSAPAGNATAQAEADRNTAPSQASESPVPESKSTRDALARLQSTSQTSVTPVAPQEDYLLAPRDQVTIQVYGQDDMTRTVRLDQDGKIVLPLVGAISIGGMTTQAAQERIEAELTKGGYLKNPKVTVAVSEFQGRQYAVMGGVNQPGSYTLRSRQIALTTAI